MSKSIVFRTSNKWFTDKYAARDFHAGKRRVTPSHPVLRNLNLFDNGQSKLFEIPWPRCPRRYTPRSRRASRLHSAEPINAFAVALCDNVRRIRDVAVRERKGGGGAKKKRGTLWLNASGESISGAEKVTIHNTTQLASHPASFALLKTWRDKYRCIAVAW